MLCSLWKKSTVYAGGKIPIFRSGSLIFVLIALMWKIRHAGRPITEKVYKILETAQQNKHFIVMELGIVHKIEARSMVHQDESTKNMIDRINICDVLLKRNEIELFLERVKTGIKKWITCDNWYHKRSWITDGERLSQAITSICKATSKA